LGRLPLMRSINMNVLLMIDYTRYAMSIEDAAKVMALLGKAKVVTSKYDDAAGDSYFQYEDRLPHVSIEQIGKPIRN
jgi:hypothetical protein